MSIITLLRFLWLLIIHYYCYSSITCWSGPFSYDVCCLPGWPGQSWCWGDGSIYNYNTCCSNDNNIIDNIGDPICWYNNKSPSLWTFNNCCYPYPNGNPSCWDGWFTPQRCCYRHLYRSLEDCDRSLEARNLFNGLEHFLDTNITALQFLESLTYSSEYWPCGWAIAITTLMSMEQQSLLSSNQEWQILHQFYQHVTQYSLSIGEPKPKGLDILYNRVHKLRNIALKHQLTLHSAEDNRSDITIVLPYCGEEVEWFEDILINQSNDEVKLLTSNYVSLNIYNKCPDRDYPTTMAYRLQNKLRSMKVLKDIMVIPSYDWIRGDECTGYLHYIINEYNNTINNNNTWTLFIHPDSPEHIPKVNIIIDVIKWTVYGLLQTLHPNLTFIHLSHNYLNPFWAKADRYNRAFRELYADVMNIEYNLSPDANDISTYCCTQLLVKNSAIKLRSIDYYTTLYNKMNSMYLYKVITRPFEVLSYDEINSRLPCQLMMPLWQVIFGNNDISTIERPLDPNIPLFIKTSNLDGDWVQAILGYTKLMYNT